MPIPLPTYGNFGGNGDNDAWEQADRWATFVNAGLEPTSYVSGVAPNASLRDPLDYNISSMTRVARNPFNIPYVLNVLDEVGRKPINDQDNAYLNHDLFYQSDDMMSNVQNNIQMGSNVYSAITATGESPDPYGYVYGATSIPFIGYVGSAYNIVEGMVTNARQGVEYIADEIVVTALQPAGDTIYVTYEVLSEGSWWDGVTSFASNAWNDFTSAVGDIAGGFGGALSSFWDWLKESFGGSNRMAGGPEPQAFDYVIDDYAAGDEATLGTLAQLDTNRDGVFDNADLDFSRIGIANDANGDGVISNDEIEALPEGTVIQVAGASELDLDLVFREDMSILNVVADDGDGLVELQRAGAGEGWAIAA